MGNIKLTIHVDASIEKVASLLSNIERIPDWQYDILEVKDVDGPLYAGAGYTLVYWRMGQRLEQRMKVTIYNPPEVVEQTANTPLGGQMRSSTRLEAFKGGTDIHWQMDYSLPGGIMGDVIDFLFFRAVFKRTVMQYLANLKALAEGKVLPHPPIRGVKPQ